MSDNCKCGPDCECKSDVVVKQEIVLKKVILGAIGKTLVDCMLKIEKYCKDNGFEKENGLLTYHTTAQGNISVDIVARKTTTVEE